MSEQEQGWEGSRLKYSIQIFLIFIVKLQKILDPPSKNLNILPPPPQHTNGKNVLDQRMNNPFCNVYYINDLNL